MHCLAFAVHIYNYNCSFSKNESNIYKTYEVIEQFKPDYIAISLYTGVSNYFFDWGLAKKCFINFFDPFIFFIEF